MNGGRMPLPRPRRWTSQGSRPTFKEMYGIGTRRNEDFAPATAPGPTTLDERGVEIHPDLPPPAGQRRVGRQRRHQDHTAPPLCPPANTDKPHRRPPPRPKTTRHLEGHPSSSDRNFGRSHWSQNTTGRDHNPKGFSSARRGGVKGGTVHGGTDDVGYKAVQNPPHIIPRTLHATTSVS